MRKSEWINEFGEIVRDENRTPPPRREPDRHRDWRPERDVRTRPQGGGGGGAGGVIAFLALLAAAIIGVAVYVVKEVRAKQNPQPGAIQVPFVAPQIPDEAARQQAEKDCARGDDYQFGRGVVVDFAEAMKWYRKAGDKGSARGQFNAGWLSEKSAPPNYGDALRWYRLSADQGNVQAQHNLGVLYENGRGTQKDYGEAMRWYRKAADQGFANSQTGVGTLYHNGWGVRQDHAEALLWYRKATAQGFADAQYNTGLLYENGQGVRQDVQQAITWYHKAAAQNHKEAGAALARLKAW